MAIKKPTEARLLEQLARQPLRVQLMGYLADLRQEELEALSKAPAGEQFRFYQGRASVLEDLVNLLKGL